MRSALNCWNLSALPSVRPASSDVKTLFPLYLTEQRPSSKSVAKERNHITFYSDKGLFNKCTVILGVIHKVGKGKILSECIVQSTNRFGLLPRCQIFLNPV